MSESEIFISTNETRNTSFYESRVRPVIVEFIGTTILVFLVCMTHERFAYLSDLVYGFTTVFLIASFGDISGGHFNPAITLGCTLAGALSIPLAVYYFFAQILGGMLGAALTRAVYPEDMYKAMVGGSTSLNPTEDVKPGWGVMTEAILTFIIVLTFLHSKVDKKSQHAPLSVGLSVAACSFAGVSLTGGSMNPARSFGPALAFTVYNGLIIDQIRYDCWEYHYIYWVGPIAGALIAALTYSGGHFNPAITLGCTVAGALSIPLAVCYFFAQILGGMLGAAFTRAVYPEEMYKAMVGGSTFLKDYKNVKPGWGVMTEALLTFIIVLTFLHSLVDKKSKLAPLSVGLTVAVCSAAGSNLTGGSMNPARSFGPTVAVTVYKCWIDVDIFNQKHVLYDGWEYHYIYWVGPIAGALFAALIYRFVLASVERRIHLHRP